DAGANAVSHSGTVGFATVAFDQRANDLPKVAIERVIPTADSGRSPALQVELGGQAIEQAQRASVGFATGVGLLAAVVVLLLSFGSLLAMGLPIVTALFGLGAGLGVIGLGSHLVDMADFASELALMIGLGVGIDYALFIVTRYRDAYRENGGNVVAAVELAMNTAGRAILFAGATVVIALLGMFALGVGFLQRVAIAAPALGLRLGASDPGNSPAGETTRKAYDLLTTGFGKGFNGPLQLAVSLPKPGDTAGLGRLTTALRGTADVASVAAPQLNAA